jgi:hypothetical protein
MLNKTTVISAIALISTLIVAPTASAAKPNRTTSGSTISQGADISYPQCGTTLPTGQTFGIVGVNNGVANTNNPCFSTQLAWAQRSSGTTVQPKAQLYVNTANPGGLNTASWPSNNVDSTGFTTSNPYGICDHSNSSACAWQYGWNRAVEDVTVRNVPSPSTFQWWLDVETGNTWDSTAGGTTRNTADLKGMVAKFQAIGTNAGIYSTSYQLGQIAGTVPANSTLNGLKSWIPGATSASGAVANCSLAPLTAGGQVTLTQFVVNSLDNDHSCI